MNWKLWLEGFASAILGGAATGITQLAAGTGQVTKGTGLAAAVGAILGAATYLKTPSFLPPADPTKP